MYKKFVAIVLLCVSFAGCNLIQKTAENNAEPRMLENITVTTREEMPTNLHTFLKTPLVIKSWSTTCPFCTKELPLLAEMQEQFGNDVRIIAINRAEDTERANRAAASWGVTNQLTLLLDKEDAFYKSIGGFTMPETIFVTKEGEIVFHKRGPLTKEELTAKIETLLAE